MMIRACIFDAFGTLFNLDPQLIKDLDHPAVQEILNYTRSKQLSYTWLYSLMGQYLPFSEITQMALKDGCKKYGAPEKLISKLSGIYFIPAVFDDVIPGLQILRKRPELTLAILSNGTIEMLNSGIQKNNLSNYMDKVYSVEKVKVFKPDPSVYKMVTDDLSCNNSEVLFVSSNQWDVAGAASFGFQVCWLNRTQQFRESITKLEYVREIGSLNEIINHIPL